jgi:hypothetical protein
MTLFALILLSLTLSAAAQWQAKKAPLMTRWAKDVSPDRAHPEYPRPQMKREKWQNLNGLWDYAIVGKDDAKPAQWAGKVLVPFPVESALSGVMQRVNQNQRLWYRRTFEVPADWNNQRILLHFGAVDWDSTVWVNGKEIGRHVGGYDPFSYDITDAIKRNEPNEIVLSIWDPTTDSYRQLPAHRQTTRPPQRHLVHPHHRHLADRLARTCPGHAHRFAEDHAQSRRQRDSDRGDVQRVRSGRCHHHQDTRRRPRDRIRGQRCRRRKRAVCDQSSKRKALESRLAVPLQFFGHRSVQRRSERYR